MFGIKCLGTPNNIFHNDIFSKSILKIVYLRIVYYVDITLGEM